VQCNPANILKPPANRRYFLGSDPERFDPHKRLPKMAIHVLVHASGLHASGLLAMSEMAANWWESLLTPQSWCGCCEEVRRFECLHEGVRGKFFARSPGSSSPLTFRHHVPQGTHAKMVQIAPKARSATLTPEASRRGFEHTVVQSAQPGGLGESTPAVVHDEGPKGFSVIHPSP